MHDTEPTEGTLSPAAKEDAASILFEGLMLLMKRKDRRAWRAICERLIEAPPTGQRPGRRRRRMSSGPSKSPRRWTRPTAATRSVA
jgi:hypothetical protein